MFKLPSVPSSSHFQLKIKPLNKRLSADEAKIIHSNISKAYSDPIHRFLLLRNKVHIEHASSVCDTFDTVMEIIQLNASESNLQTASYQIQALFSALKLSLTTSQQYLKLFNHRLYGAPSKSSYFNLKVDSVQNISITGVNI